MSCGEDSTCAVDGNNDLWCWGNNSVGLLGNGTTTNSNVPTRVMGLSQVNDIVATQNKAFCRGFNIEGQVGLGLDTINNWLEIANMNFRFITADVFRTCAIDTAGALYCWGQYPLGDGAYNSNPRPVRAMDPR